MTLNNKEIFSLYKIAIEARNFHYSNVHKWMSFYYIPVAAIFVAYYMVLTNANNLHKDLDYNWIIIIILFIGFIVSMLWHLSAKGYYFWSIHWIKVVNKFEKELYPQEYKYRVYTIFSEYVRMNEKYCPVSGGLNISTPKSLMLLSYFSALIFIFFLWYHIGVKFLWCLDCFLQKTCFVIIVLLLGIGTNFVFIKLGRKYLSNSMSHFIKFSCDNDGKCHYTE